MKRFVDGADGRVLLPEAGARRPRPTGSRPPRSRSPAGAARPSCAPNDAAHLIWAVNLGVHRPQPVAGAARRRRPSRRAARRPRPDAGVELRADVRQVAMIVREVLDDHGLRGFPKTSGSRGIHINVRIEPRVGVHRGAPRGARPRARGRAPHPGARDDRSGGRRSATASSSTTTRTPATAPSPRRTRCAPSPTPASRARSSGTRCPTSSRRSCTSRRCRRASPSAATRRPTIDEHATRSTPCSSSPHRDEAEGLGDAPWPPHFRKQARRAASGCSRAGRRRTERRGVPEREGAPGAAGQRLRLHRPAGRAPPADQRRRARPQRAFPLRPGGVRGRRGARPGRARLLRAAKKYGIMPIGFISAQLQPQRRLPNGHVTFLLTDIEGSTELLTRLEDAYASLLADVRRLVPRRSAATGGTRCRRAATTLRRLRAAPAARSRRRSRSSGRCATPTWPGERDVRLRIGLHRGRP